MVGPTKVKTPRPPTERRQDVDAVSPFYLAGVKQKVRQAISGDQQKGKKNALGEQGDRQGQKTAAEKRALANGVSLNLVAVDERRRRQDAPDYPRYIRDDASNENQADIGGGREQAADRQLRRNVTEGIRHENMTEKKSPTSQANRSDNRGERAANMAHHSRFITFLQATDAEARKCR
jgi:hypothetical protein